MLRQQRESRTALGSQQKETHSTSAVSSWLVKCCSTCIATVGLLGTETQDVHLDFHTPPELCGVQPPSAEDNARLPPMKHRQKETAMAVSRQQTTNPVPRGSQ